MTHVELAWDKVLLLNLIIITSGVVGWKWGFEVGLISITVGYWMASVNSYLSNLR